MTEASPPLALQPPLFLPGPLITLEVPSGQVIVALLLPLSFTVHVSLDAMSPELPS